MKAFVGVVGLLAAWLAPSVVFAQAAAPSAYDESLARSVGADEHGMRSYVLVVLKTGPNKVPAGPERDEMFRGHFANMKRLAAEGKLALAGPFDGADGWRGLFDLCRGGHRGGKETDVDGSGHPERGDGGRVPQVLRFRRLDARWQSAQESRQEGALNGAVRRRCFSRRRRRSGTSSGEPASLTHRPVQPLNKARDVFLGCRPAGIWRSGFHQVVRLSDACDRHRRETAGRAAYASDAFLDRDRRVRFSKKTIGTRTREIAFNGS